MFFSPGCDSQRKGKVIIYCGMLLLESDVGDSYIYYYTGATVHSAFVYSHP